MCAPATQAPARTGRLPGLPRVRPAALAVLGAPFVAGGAVVATRAVGPSLCPTQILFGVACPFCGSTRAVASLVQGDVAMAWTFQPMIFVVVLAALAWLATELRLLPRPQPAIRNRIPWAILAMFFATWLVRWPLGALDAVII